MSPYLDGRQPVVEVRSSRAKSASQKPYSSSLGAGSQGQTVLEIYSLDHWCTQTLGMEKLWRRHSIKKRQKPWLDYIGLSNTISCRDHDLNYLGILSTNLKAK